MAGSRTPFAFLDLRFSPSKSLVYGEHLRKGKKENHHKNITGIAFNTERRKQDKREGRGTARSNSGAPTRTGPIAISPCGVAVGGVVVESSSHRAFRRHYQEGYGWEDRQTNNKKTYQNGALKW
jgi:hypothetical protein